MYLNKIFHLVKCKFELISNTFTLQGQSYPIHIAAQGKPDIVKLLINAKCDVNVRDHVSSRSKVTFNK